MIGILLCQLIDLFAKKKLLVNLSYLVGTTIFILLSYNTANQLTVVPSTGENRTSEAFDSVFHRRSEHVQSQCRYSGTSSRTILTTLFHRSHLLNHLGFVLRSHSFFYCSVPKVATRTFLLFITYLHVRDELLTNFTSTTSRKIDHFRQLLPSLHQNETALRAFLSDLRSHNRVNASEIGLWKVHQDGLFPSVRLRTVNDPSLIFSPSFQRVIFVRHPLERLASAYADKIGRIHSKPFSLYDGIRRSICRKYPSAYLTTAEQRSYRENPQLRTHLNEPCATKIPSFEHFLDYLTSDSVQNDVHWQPYSSLCRVCLFRYNFIGKYETLADDYSHLLSRLGLNSSEWIRNNPFSTGRTKESYRAMFAELPDRTVCFLKEFYREDLKHFQYDFDEYFPRRRSTNCSAVRFAHFPRNFL